MEMQMSWLGLRRVQRESRKACSIWRAPVSVEFAYALKYKFGSVTALLIAVK